MTPKPATVPLPTPSPAAVTSAREKKREAARARWNHKAELKADWEGMPIEDAIALIAQMREDMQTGSEIVQRRMSTMREPQVCDVCKATIPGNPISIIPYKVEGTDLWKNKFYCSAECVARKNQAEHGVLSLAR